MQKRAKVYFYAVLNILLMPLVTYFLLIISVVLIQEKKMLSPSALFDILIVLIVIIGGVIVYANMGIAKEVALTWNVKPIQKDDNKRIYGLVEIFCIYQGVSMPSIYILPIEAKNTFSLGWSMNNWTLFITQGLIDSLTDEEINCVLAFATASFKSFSQFVSNIVNAYFSLHMTAGTGLTSAVLNDSSYRKRSVKGDLIMLILGLIIGRVAKLIMKPIQGLYMREKVFYLDLYAMLMVKNRDLYIRTLQKFSPVTDTILPTESINQFDGSFYSFARISYKKEESFKSVYPTIEERIALIQQSDTISHTQWHLSDLG